MRYRSAAPLAVVPGCVRCLVVGGSSREYGWVYPWRPVVIRPRQNGRSSAWSTPLRGTRDSISKLRELAVDGEVGYDLGYDVSRRRRRPPFVAAAVTSTIRDVSPSPSCSSFCQSARASAPVLHDVIILVLRYRRDIARDCGAN